MIHRDCEPVVYLKCSDRGIRFSETPVVVVFDLLLGVVTRAAYTGREAVIDHGYDVYELLGVEADAAVPEIKQAYRWLQKRCHPDIAGPIGHDMAILLNDAYATLSNPTLRAIYDVVRTHTIYSWFCKQILFMELFLIVWR